MKKQQIFKLQCPICESNNDFDNRTLLFDHLSSIHNVESEERRNEIILWNEFKRKGSRKIVSNSIKKVLSKDKKSSIKEDKISRYKGYDKKILKGKSKKSIKLIFTPMGNKR